MPVTLVVGAQWGDEGKGRIVDFLAMGASAVARYGGGANAGHTVQVGEKTYKLRLVPSGIVAGVEACIIGPGTVISPSIVLGELDALAGAGVDVSRVWISDLAHLILPYHVALDRAWEQARGGASIGTTGNGIGPAYMDRVARVGIRAGDLADSRRWQQAVRDRCAAIRAHGVDVDANAIVAELEAQCPRLMPHVRDTIGLVHEFLRAGKRVLAEGAQGTMLDVGLGTYPYVTSSVTIAGGGESGLGYGPSHVEHVVGVTKSYATRVGNGPFPSELHDAAGTALQQRGREFGVVTGRARRCGWLDLAALRYAVAVNGITHLAMTKLDVLDEFDEVGVCSRYAGGDPAASLPFAIEAGAKPVMTMLRGWRAATSAARSWNDLPREAQAFIAHVEAETATPVSYISVGPERSQIIVRPGAPLAQAAMAR
ncbi:MAG TPA: adenylosuccinate synthase [Candidatus Eremiobacteraceae bacterium]|nr:adenylosuccinate synthase [Candidatus Eremiobacteraceae bacterium]